MFSVRVRVSFPTDIWLFESSVDMFSCLGSRRFVYFLDLRHGAHDEGTFLVFLTVLSNYKKAIVMILCHMLSAFGKYAVMSCKHMKI